MTIQNFASFEADTTRTSATSKLVKAWEAKNAKRAVKASGATLMALSLSACGGSDDTPAGDGTPDVPAVTPVALALTAENDILTSADFTTGADTITATQATYGAADVIVEGTDGDGDTLTITTNADITATPTVVGIENIVVNSSQFAGAGNGIDFNATGIASGTLTLNNVQVGSADDTASVTAAGNITVVAGTSVDTLNVTMVADADTVVNAGDATAVNVVSVNDATATGQVATVVANGNVALDTTNGGAGTLTDVNVTSTVASEVTFTDTGTDVDTMTGDANTTFVGATLAVFDGLTVTGAAAVEGAGGTADLTDVATQINITDDTAADLTVADGASVTAEVVGANLISLFADNDGDLTTDSEQSVTLTLSDDSTNAAGVAGYDIAIEDNATDAGDEITTVNLVVTGDLDHDVTADGDVRVDVSQNANDTTLNISGAGDIDLAIVNGGGDLTINAAELTGGLVVSAAADVLTITGGSGDDEITALTNVEFALVGGDGTDTLNTAALMQSGTFSGFEVLSITDGNDFLASQLSGYTAVVTAITGSIEIVDASDIDTDTIDMSGLTAARVADDIDIDLGQIDATVLLAGDAITYTGWNGVDTVAAGANGDTITTLGGDDDITGGAGADIITTGEGSDAVDVNGGADVVDLSEVTEAVDTVTIDTADGSVVGTVAGTFTGFNVITGFTSGSDQIDVTVNATGAADTVLTQNAATTASNDLADGDHTDVDAVAAFLTDSSNGLASAAGDIDVIAITFSDYTAIYSVTSAGADATVSAGELQLLATVDDILVAADII